MISLYVKTEKIWRNREYFIRMQTDNGADCRKATAFEMIGYGAGNMGFGIVLQLMVAYLVFYGTAVLRIPGSLVGLLASIGVIWDAVTDPVMGHISDNTTFKKWGRRHAYMLWGAIGIVVINVFLWRAPLEFSSFGKFLYLLVAVLLLRTFATIYSVPYNALAAEMTEDYNQRSTVQSYKTIFFVLGLILPTVLGLSVFFKPTEQFEAGQFNPEAYSLMGIWGSVFVLLLSLPCVFITRKYATFAKAPTARFSLKAVALSFWDAIKDANFGPIALGYLLVNFASAWVGGVGMHMFTYSLGMKSGQIALCMGAMFGTAILAQPLWLAVAARLDKRRALLRAMVLGIVGAVIMAFAMAFARLWLMEAWYAMIPVMAVLGAGVGGMLTLPNSMVTDAIVMRQYRTGIRAEGMYFGALTLSYKLSQSLSMLILGLLLEAIRFNANLPAQSLFTVQALGLILPVGCLIAFVCAYAAYARYPLTKPMVDEAQEAIDAGRFESIS